VAIWHNQGIVGLCLQDSVPFIKTKKIQEKSIKNEGYGDN